MLLLNPPKNKQTNFPPSTEQWQTISSPALIGYFKNLSTNTNKAMTDMLWVLN